MSRTALCLLAFVLCAFLVLPSPALSSAEGDKHGAGVQSSMGATAGPEKDGADMKKEEGVNKAGGDTAGQGAPEAAEKEEEEKGEEGQGTPENTDEGSDNAQTFPTKSKSHITVVSNNNALNQVLPSPEQMDHEALMEQDKKHDQEEFKKQGHEDQKKEKQEQWKKKEQKEAADRQRAQEEGDKKERKEAEGKKMAEQDHKDKRKQAALKEKNDKAQQKKEQDQKAKITAQEKTKKAEQAVKGKKASEQKSKAAEKRAKHMQEQRKKNNGFRPHHPWTNYGHGYHGAYVHKASSYCFATGLLRGHHGLVGTLPGHCRPYQGRLIFAQMKGGYNSRVDVLPDGRVYHITGGGGHWLSLDGISFDTHRRHNLQLVWHWRPYGHGYRHVTQSNLYGLCMMSGLIRSGRWGYFARAMHGCWPRDGRLIFSANNHAHITRTDVLTNGYILRSGGYAYHHWVSLDGIIFSPHGGAQLPLYNGWHNYMNSYRTARWVRRGPFCIVSGLIKSGSWHGHITTLPGHCRPAARLIFGTNVHMRSARVDVLPNGQVHYVNGKMHWHWLSLDGIRFRVR